MKQMTFKVFSYPELLPAFERNEVNIVPRVLKGDIDTSKVYSKMGYPGDIWLICESGKMHDGQVFERRSGGAVMKDRIGSVVPVIHPFTEEDGKPLKADEMPRWAARFRYKIEAVSSPFPLSAIDEDLIYNMGVRMEKKGGVKLFRWGGIEVPNTSMVSAFEKMWDATYNKSGLCGMSDNVLLTLYTISNAST